MTDLQTAAPESTAIRPFASYRTHLVTALLGAWRADLCLQTLAGCSIIPCDFGRGKLACTDWIAVDIMAHLRERVSGCDKQRLERGA